MHSIRWYSFGYLAITFQLIEFDVWWGVFAFVGEDEKDKKRRLKAEEAMKKWEDLKESGDNQKSMCESIFAVQLFWIETDEISRRWILIAGEPKSVRTPLEKWELSLHACTSFSQLYVHLALLG